MDQNKENKFSSYKATSEVLNTHNLVWAANVAFSANVTKFRALYLKTSAEIEKQETVITGFAKDKHKKRIALVNSAMIFIGAGIAFAKVKSNSVLEDAISFTRSDLNKQRDMEFISTLFVVHSKLSEVIGELADYGITPPMLVDFNTLITQFENLVQSPRSAIADRSASTELLNPLFKDIDDTLSILDSLVEVFKPTNEDFYLAYKSSRIIVDLGIRHKKDGTPNPPTP